MVLLECVGLQRERVSEATLGQSRTINNKEGTPDCLKDIQVVIEFVVMSANSVEFYDPFIGGGSNRLLSMPKDAKLCGEACGSQSLFVGSEGSEVRGIMEDSELHHSTRGTRVQEFDEDLIEDQDKSPVAAQGTEALQDRQAGELHLHWPQSCSRAMFQLAKLPVVLEMEAKLFTESWEGLG
ncbi:hypothetical protein NDU88_005068 [Pleurodeles waltl]|uniref:Uncharacterized protein n=1 Tax=Pleurodeles waltl TaxID=8319 RepID=A0AAV7RHZ5_PLEWA|nr:hypothetical protein NDU88_005068 [Pleurodeles waltl]